MTTDELKQEADEAIGRYVEAELKATGRRVHTYKLSFYRDGCRSGSVDFHFQDPPKQLSIPTLKRMKRSIERELKERTK